MPEINPGKADGWFGDGTERALNAYLSAKGMDPNGIVTKEVYDMLIEDSKINEYTRLISEAQEQAEADARALLAEYSSIEDINRLDR